MAKGKKGKAAPGHVWPADAPLATMQTILLRVNLGLSSHNFGMDGDPQENLSKLATTNITNLDKFTIGNARHVAAVSVQVETVADLLRKMADLIDAHAPPMPPRTQFAGVSVLAGSQMVGSALLMHMRASDWYVNSTLILLRTALEQAAIGGVIARGTGSEATQWLEGPKLPTPKDRQNAEFRVAQCCKDLAPFISTHSPIADDPTDIYRWLCNFTHLNSAVLTNKPSHEDAYAALAYVGWFCAVMGEIVIGVPGIAIWPSIWPAKLPWKP